MDVRKGFALGIAAAGWLCCFALMLSPTEGKAPAPLTPSKEKTRWKNLDAFLPGDWTANWFGIDCPATFFPGGRWQCFYARNNWIGTWETIEPNVVVIRESINGTGDSLLTWRMEFDLPASRRESRIETRDRKVTFTRRYDD